VNKIRNSKLKFKRFVLCLWGGVGWGGGIELLKRQSSVFKIMKFDVGYNKSL
jgi:hypothetical protein